MGCEIPTSGAGGASRTDRVPIRTWRVSWISGSSSAVSGCESHEMEDAIDEITNSNCPNRRFRPNWRRSTGRRTPSPQSPDLFPGLVGPVRAHQAAGLGITLREKIVTTCCSRRDSAGRTASSSRITQPQPAHRAEWRPPAPSDEDAILTQRYVRTSPRRRRRDHDNSAAPQFCNRIRRVGGG